MTWLGTESLIAVVSSPGPKINGTGRMQDQPREYTHTWYNMHIYIYLYIHVCIIRHVYVRIYFIHIYIYVYTYSGVSVCVLNIYIYRVMYIYIYGPLNSNVICQAPLPAVAPGARARRALRWSGRAFWWRRRPPLSSRLRPWPPPPGVQKR